MCMIDIYPVFPNDISGLFMLSQYKNPGLSIPRNCESTSEIIPTPMR